MALLAGLPNDEIALILGFAEDQGNILFARQ